MEKITSYKQIPKFTNEGVYHVDMSPAWLIKWIQEEETTMGLELNPNFQRGHVWTREQQIAYVEYRLRGGKSGVDLYFNCSFWFEGKRGNTGYQAYVCVDGLQRITAWVIHDSFANKNPEISEQTPETPEKTVTPACISPDTLVYVTPKGKSYHLNRNCSTLSRSKTILEKPFASCGKSDPCNRCVK